MTKKLLTQKITNNFLLTKNFVYEKITSVNKKLQ
ncbi:hypothetical protein BPA_0900009 [Borrelia parkeri SLO]|uniref:Uncharacterized protein n=1 Tax=Borrelia parkeri SLO TaxID=1313294 RepID=A0ABN4C6S3_BORPR|nr:hypothetical protein BPA_0900009 [Borrelia parkeri SLO]